MAVMTSKNNVIGFTVYDFTNYPVSSSSQEVSQLFHLYDCFVQISVSKSWCGEKIPAKNVLRIHSMSACPLSKCLLLEKRAIFVP